MRSRIFFMSASYSNLKALVVDDYEKIRATLSKALKGLGLAVIEANDGFEALERLRAENFDIVFTDIVMPQMDGFELCHEIRSSVQHKDLPIVAVSTHFDTNYIIKALKFGADDYLPKPVRMELLEKVIARVTTDLGSQGQ